MTHLSHGPGGSHREGRVAAARPRFGPDLPRASREPDRPMTAGAVLDRLRDAAAAHDGDLPELEMPASLRCRSA